MCSVPTRLKCYYKQFKIHIYNWRLWNKFEDAAGGKRRQEKKRQFCSLVHAQSHQKKYSLLNICAFYPHISPVNPFHFLLQAVDSGIVFLAISLLVLDWMHFYILFLLTVSSYIHSSDFFL